VKPPQWEQTAMFGETEMTEEDKKQPEAPEDLTDETADEATDSAAGDAEASAEEALAAAEARAEENWNEYLKAKAEVENVRRRAEKDAEQAKRSAQEKIATEMLAVKDSLEMGVAAAQEPDADVAKLREGSELTLKMLDQAFDKFKIEAVDPTGERFDPNRHEAMAAQPSEEHEPNTVIHAVQKGYLLGERLLRPAMVIVAKASEGEGSDGAPDSEA